MERHLISLSAVFLLGACTADRNLNLVIDESGPDDGFPGMVSDSPDGQWRASVATGGELHLGPSEEEGTVVDYDVLIRVAWSPDSNALVYSTRNSGESELMWVRPYAVAATESLVDWEGPQDRPVFSPSGRSLAFVSGHTGFASVWVLHLDSEEAIQLNNVDLVRTPGTAPEGFMPPPEDVMEWTETTLSWSAQGQNYSVEVL
jgi:hypothetical protein